MFSTRSTSSRRPLRGIPSDPCVSRNMHRTALLGLHAWHARMRSACPFAVRDNRDRRTSATPARGCPDGRWGELRILAKGSTHECPFLRLYA